MAKYIRLGMKIAYYMLAIEYYFRSRQTEWASENKLPYVILNTV